MTLPPAADGSFDVLSMNCPSRVILQRIGDRWSIFVIAALSQEVLRFTQLKQRIGGLVAREVFAEMPPRVEYRLTPLGRSLLGPISAVRSWAETHVAEVLQARERAQV